MIVKTFKKGEVIFRQGDYAEEMYDIRFGSVAVYVGYGTDDETQLTTLKAGQFLGEMGMIESYPRSATAVAAEDGTELVTIDRDTLSEYFKNQPERLLEIMRHISMRIRVLTEEYTEACRIRDELIATQKKPETRKKSLLERIREYLDFYNECLKSVPVDYISLNPEFYHFSGGRHWE